MKEFLEVTEELKVPDGEVLFTWDNDRNGKRVLAIYQVTSRRPAKKPNGKPEVHYRRASVRLDRSQVAELISMLEKGCSVQTKAPPYVMDIHKETKEVIKKDWLQPAVIYQCPECGGLSDNLVCTHCSKEE